MREAQGFPRAGQAGGTPGLEANLAKAEDTECPVNEAKHQRPSQGAEHSPAVATSALGKLIPARGQGIAGMWGSGFPKAAKAFANDCSQPSHPAHQQPRAPA